MGSCGYNSNRLSSRKLCKKATGDTRNNRLSVSTGRRLVKPGRKSQFQYDPDASVATGPAFGVSLKIGGMGMYEEIRLFKPIRTDDLRKECLPWIGKEVTVVSWHENISMKEKYPSDERVGFVKEFALDIPESELL